MSIRPVFAVAIFVVSCLAAFNSASAQPGEINVQKQWTYMKHTDETSGKVQFLATTAAIEDDNAWLLLACGEDGRITFSIIYTGGFPFSLKSPVSVLWRIDVNPAVTTAAVMIGPTQIAIGSRVSNELLSFVVDGSRLSASISDADGKTHSYAWSLEPSDVALADIRGHCLEDGNE
jgi:hypothetical protein